MIAVVVFAAPFLHTGQAVLIAAEEAGGAGVTDPIADWPGFRSWDGRGTWQAPRLDPARFNQAVRTVWQQPVGPGYSGIAVWQGGLYTMDRLSATSQERIGCWDARTGRLRWQFVYEAAYGDLDYGKGPRATPLVDGGRVYCIGAVGHIHCLDANTGKLLWSRHAVSDLGGRQPTWGFAASPIVHQGKLVLHIGSPSGTYVALEPESGQVLWRAGSDECGYATPIVTHHAGVDMLIGWTPQHVLGIDIADGRLLWKIPYPVTYGVSIASPIVHDGIVLVSGYWEGTKAIQLGDRAEEARLLWEDTRHLRALMAQPLYRQGLVYLLDKQHGFSCFELATGRVLWTDQHRLTPAGRNPHASIVWAGEDQILALNSNGELVWATVSASGYRELGRKRIIGSTWAHPAYCGHWLFARSDEQVVAVHLESIR